MLNYPLEFTKQQSPSGYFINLSFNNKVDYKWSINTYEQVCYVLEAMLAFYSYKNGLDITVDTFSKYGYITLDDGSNLCLPELLITEELSPIILIEYFNEKGNYYTSYVDFSFILKDKKHLPVEVTLDFYNSLNEKDKHIFNEVIDQQTVDLAYSFLQDTVKELDNKPNTIYNASLSWSTRDFN